MVTGDYRDLFVVIATSAATLIGLLFVALSVAESRVGSRPKIVRQFRAAASFLAFINALTVGLFGLVPGTNVGIPALVLGTSGLLFTAAGARRTVEFWTKRSPEDHQSFLFVLLSAAFGFELAFGIVLVVNVHDTSALTNLGDILIVFLLIGIARAWELAGEWNTGIWASIGFLLSSAHAADKEAAPAPGTQSTHRSVEEAPDDER
jgi:hypothetical protein